MSDLRIPPLDINPDTITAVGISSGGFMTTMMFLTDPELFKGIGPVISGTPLVESKIMPTDGKFSDIDPSKFPDIDFDSYIKKLYAKEKAGEIGPFSAIKGAPVY